MCTSLAAQYFICVEREQMGFEINLNVYLVEFRAICKLHWRTLLVVGADPEIINQRFF